MPMGCMRSDRVHALTVTCVIACCIALARGEDGPKLGEAALGHRSYAKHHFTAHRLTHAVSQRDCRRDQQPAHLQGSSEATAELADYVFTTAVGYQPSLTRAFLATFRQHNKAARVVNLVSPDQVWSPLLPLTSSPALSVLLECLPCQRGRAPCQETESLRVLLQWMQLRQPLCEYGRRYGVEYHSLEPSEYYPVVLLRFLGYLEILRGPGTASARNVLMTDVRDVLFQGDPFAPAVLPASRVTAHRAGDALPYVLFTEEGDYTYVSTFRNDSYDQAWVRTPGGRLRGRGPTCCSPGACVAGCRDSSCFTAVRATRMLRPAGARPHACRRRACALVLSPCRGSACSRVPACCHTSKAGGAGQVRDCFNDSVVDAMLDVTVVCAGTIMGGRDATIAYLRLMSDIAHFVAKEACMAFGVDQAIHNYIVHYLKPRRPDLLRFEALLISNYDSPIFTVGMLQPPYDVKIVGTALDVRNRKGVRPPLLHQVDRKDEFRDYLNIFSLTGSRRLRHA